MAIELTRLEKRAKYVRDYIETSLSENQIRQMYALFLSGDRRKLLSHKRTLIAEHYQNCPREYKSVAVVASYDEIIRYLIDNWDKK